MILRVQICCFRIEIAAVALPASKAGRFIGVIGSHKALKPWRCGQGLFKAGLVFVLTGRGR
jgi:hypothetical protein